MKRWITLILAAVTLMCGCALTILAEGNADGIPDAATEIAQIDKYGNIDLSISPEALRELGYEPGDIIQVKIGDTDIEMPIGTHYTDVDFGAPICCFRTSGDGTEKTVLAICSGNLAETASIAEKHTVDSDPGFEWRYLGSYDASVTVLFSMVQKQGYADEYALHQLLNSKTDKREDYPQLTDAGEIAADYMRTFSNFYGLREGTDQYQKISDSFLESSLAAELGLSSVRNADLKSAAEAYLKRIGMTDDEIASLKDRLARDYSEET